MATAGQKRGRVRNTRPARVRSFITSEGRKPGIGICWFLGAWLIFFPQRPTRAQTAVEGTGFSTLAVQSTWVAAGESAPGRSGGCSLVGRSYRRPRSASWSLCRTSIDLRQRNRSPTSLSTSTAARQRRKSASSIMWSRYRKRGRANWE